MVAYFPNFGGFVPYNDWRCNLTSQDCLSRITETKDYGKTKIMLPEFEVSTKDALLMIMIF